MKSCLSAFFSATPHFVTMSKCVVIKNCSDFNEVLPCETKKLLLSSSAVDSTDCFPIVDTFLNNVQCYTQLRMLSISIPKHHLTSVDKLVDLTSLTYLRICHNTLRWIEPISAMTQLRFLDLSCCRNIHNIEYLKPLVNLITLDLDYCPVKSLESLTNLTKLVRLSLTKVAISDWDTAMEPLTQLPRLRSLDCSRNGWIDIPKTFLRLTTLVKLNIAHQYQPYKFVTSLKNLTLNCRLETKTLATLGCLTTLESLSLNECYITEIPPDFAALIRLTHLNIEGNNLTSLPAELYRLVGLTKSPCIRCTQIRIGGLDPMYAQWSDIRQHLFCTNATQSRWSIDVIRVVNSLDQQ